MTEASSRFGPKKDNWQRGVGAVLVLLHAKYTQRRLTGDMKRPLCFFLDDTYTTKLYICKYDSRDIFKKTFFKIENC